jgi:membrane-bound serine protease (ClpP class)
MIGLTVELWNPGAVLPGVAGVLSLLLAFFALQVIPINTTGLLLMALGVGLLVLELKVPSGVLGIGGTIALVIGSVMMTETVPGVRVGFGFVIPAAIAFAAFFLFLGRLALQSQRRPPVSGKEGLIGAHGRARDPLMPNTPGYVHVRGELWRAMSDVTIASGEPVRVRAVNGLTLTVEPLDTSAPAEAGHNQPGTHGESA